MTEVDSFETCLSRESSFFVSEVGEAALSLFSNGLDRKAVGIRHTQTHESTTFITYVVY